jgi:hypothetical protein
MAKQTFARDVINSLLLPSTANLKLLTMNTDRVRLIMDFNKYSVISTVYIDPWTVLNFIIMNINKVYVLTSVPPKVKVFSLSFHLLLGLPTSRCPRGRYWRLLSIRSRRSNHFVSYNFISSTLLFTFNLLRMSGFLCRSNLVSPNSGLRNLICAASSFWASLLYVTLYSTFVLYARCMYCLLRFVSLQAPVTMEPLALLLAAVLFVAALLFLLPTDKKKAELARRVNKLHGPTWYPIVGTVLPLLLIKRNGKCIWYYTSVSYQNCRSHGNAIMT